MSRKYPKSPRVRKQPGRIRQIKQQALEQAREVQLPLDVETLVEMTRQSLSSFAVEVGLKVAQCLLEDEVTQRCGQRHERLANRTETRFGHQRGFVTIADQKVPVAKPRVRYTDNRGEASWNATRYCNRPTPCASGPRPLGERRFDAALRAGRPVGSPRLRCEEGER